MWIQYNIITQAFSQNDNNANINILFYRYSSIYNTFALSIPLSKLI